MPNTVVNSTSNKLFAPLMGLAFFAIASGYLMSLLPLALGHYSLPVHLGPWLASVYYTGLLFGAFKAQAIISALGHRVAFVVFLLSLLVSVVFMLLLPNSLSWLVLGAVAGAATAGIFVVVESWLLFVDCDKQRASRLGFYMVTLYAGNALGQLLIEYLGTGGGLPFLCIIALLGLAIVAPLLSQNSAPQHTQHQALSLKTIATLSKPAVMGCLVSGLILGPIYGLMPAYLNSDALWRNNIGSLMATLILGGMLVQPICSYLSARFNKTLLQALISALGLLAAIGIVLVKSVLGLSLCLFALGAAAFALYPIAICQACYKASATSIVAITELMLLSYSLGSIIGPLFAGLGTQSSQALPMYLAAIFVTTSVYMLLVASKSGTLPEPV